MRRPGTQLTAAEGATLTQPVERESAWPARSRSRKVGESGVCSGLVAPGRCDLATLRGHLAAMAARCSPLKGVDRELSRIFITFPNYWPFLAQIGW